jgi:hypothetical protein
MSDNQSTHEKRSSELENPKQNPEQVFLKLMKSKMPGQIIQKPFRITIL